MDHYPEFNVSERECPSRRDSNASSIQKSSTIHHESTDPQNGHLAPPHYTSIPTPSDAPQQQRARNDSVHSDTSSSSQHDMDSKNAQSHGALEQNFTRYTDAPPPYSEKQYEGKSEDERAKMRMMDYAKELSRMMGRQLVRGMRNGEGQSS